jgi:hypothetical protein
VKRYEDSLLEWGMYHLPKTLGLTLSMDAGDEWSADFGELREAIVDHLQEKRS